MRGRISLGEISILFQFVQAPPSAKLQLPSHLRAGRSLDHTFFKFLLSSAGLQLLAVGLLLSLDLSTSEINLENVEGRFVDGIIFSGPERALEQEVEEEKLGEELEDSKVKPEPEKPKKSSKRSKDPAPRLTPATPKEQAQQRRERAQRRIQRETIIGVIGSQSGEGLGGITNILGDEVAAIKMEHAFTGTQAVVVNGARRISRKHKRFAQHGELVALGEELKSTQAKGPVKSGYKREKKIKALMKMGKVKEPIGTGVLSPESIARKVKARMSLIKGCYERHLQRNKNLKGKITIEFSINPRGRVSSTRIIKNTTGVSAIGRCIEQNFKRRLRFPRPKGGSVTVRFPFFFTAQGR